MAEAEVLTDRDLRRLLLKEVGENDDSTLAELLPTMWTLKEAEAQGDLGLQYLLVKKQALFMLCYGKVDEINVEDQGVSQQWAQTFEHRKSMLDSIDGEIETYRELAQAGRSPLIGLITKIAVFDNPDGDWPWGLRDPNARILRGDPIIREFYK